MVFEIFVDTTPNNNIHIRKMLFKLFFLFAFFFRFTEPIRCYQCSSADGTDSCGVYGSFDKERNVPVDCQGDEAVTPGTMCIKITQQSPRGFIWDGRWRQVIRRCTSVANTGVTGVCNWGIYENGVYWEECYCSEDACNSSRHLKPQLLISTFVPILSALCTLAFILPNYHFYTYSQ